MRGQNGLRRQRVLKGTFCPFWTRGCVALRKLVCGTVLSLPLSCLELCPLPHLPSACSHMQRRTSLRDRVASSPLHADVLNLGCRLLCARQVPSDAVARDTVASDPLAGDALASDALASDPIPSDP